MPEAVVIPSGTAPDEKVAQGCAACPHRWAAHDEIGARFCAATLVGRFSRGCVCAPTSALT